MQYNFSYSCDVPNPLSSFNLACKVMNGLWREYKSIEVKGVWIVRRLRTVMMIFGGPHQVQQATAVGLKCGPNSRKDSVGWSNCHGPFPDMGILTLRTRDSRKHESKIIVSTLHAPERHTKSKSHASYSKPRCAFHNRTSRPYSFSGAHLSFIGSLTEFKNQGLLSWFSNSISN